MKQIVLSVMTALVLLGCNKESSQGASAQQADPMRVEPAAELSAQLRLAEAQLALVTETLRVAGNIGFDEQRLARIGASITGRVT